MPKQFLKSFLGIFCVLFIAALPFPYHVIPNVGAWVSQGLAPIIHFMGIKIFGLSEPFTTAVLSDSTGLYIQTIFIAVLAFFISLITVKFFAKNEKEIGHFLNVFLTYYLALQLYIYSFDKLFKSQFYLPEPNIVFTPFGMLGKDILYWSSMGTSYGYSVFLGVIEVLAATLLLFRKTRFIAALMAIGILLNIVAINFCFDISVKLYACFLLLISILLAADGLKKGANGIVLLERQYLVQRTKSASPERDTDKESGKNTIFSNTKKPLIVFSALKTLAIGIILLEALFIYFQTSNFNDDKQERPYLHGAYAVDVFVKNNDTIPLLITDNTLPKRFFIHRKNYFIIQYMDDAMVDYTLEIDSTKQHFLLKDYNNKSTVFSYTLDNDSTIILMGKFNTDSIRIHASKIDLNALPVFKSSFHLTTDDYN